MYNPSNEFIQANEELQKIQDALSFNDKQFKRIKSVIANAAIWCNATETLMLDLNKEFQDDCEMKEELELRYEAAKRASTSAKELWNQLNRCVDKEISKESLLMILNGFIAHFEIFAKRFNHGKDTEILINLRKIRTDIENIQERYL